MAGPRFSYNVLGERSYYCERKKLKPESAAVDAELITCRELECE